MRHITGLCLVTGGRTIPVDGAIGDRLSVRRMVQVMRFNQFFDQVADSGSKSWLDLYAPPSTAACWLHRAIQHGGSSR